MTGEATRATAEKQQACPERGHPCVWRILGEAYPPSATEAMTPYDAVEATTSYYDYLWHILHTARGMRCATPSLGQHYQTISLITYLIISR